MSITISQSKTALAPMVSASFLAAGGTAPYVYSVVPGGAGGTINASTGKYVTPVNFSSDVKKLFDVIIATDAVNATVTTKILVGSPLRLVAEIIQKELGLAPDRVYLWDQKLMQFTDSELYVVVSLPSATPFGNSNTFVAVNDGDTPVAVQRVSMLGVIDIDVISRGPVARDRKEEVVLALKSNYAKNQQTSNSFLLASIPTSFHNLSEVDGAAIPYRYRISVKMQYAYVKVTTSTYFDDFENSPMVTTES